MKRKWERSPASLAQIRAIFTLARGACARSESANSSAGRRATRLGARRAQVRPEKKGGQSSTYWRERTGSVSRVVFDRFRIRHERIGERTLSGRVASRTFLSTWPVRRRGDRSGGISRARRCPDGGVALIGFETVGSRADHSRFKCAVGRRRRKHGKRRGDSTEESGGKGRRAPEQTAQARRGWRRRGGGQRGTLHSAHRLSQLVGPKPKISQNVKL